MTNQNKLGEALQEMWQLIKALKDDLFESTEMEKDFLGRIEGMWRKLSIGRY